MPEGTPTARPPAMDSQPTRIPDVRAPRRRRLIAVILVAVVIVGPLLVVWNLWPWEEAVLAHGRTYVDVPLTTLYTAPSRTGETVNTSVEVSYLPGFWSDNHSATPPAFIEYRWSSVSGTDLPVRFVMGPAFPMDQRSQFAGDTKGIWFSFFPAGGMPRVSESSTFSPLNISAVGPGTRSVAVTKWAMDYTVRKMAVLQGFIRTNFLEVDYSLTVVNRGFVVPLSDSNVTSPASADLVASGSPVSVAPGQPIVIDGNSFSGDSRPPFTTYEPFYYDLTRIGLDAGSAGVLRVGLTSMNAWLAVCEHAQPPCWFQTDYWLHVSTSNNPLWFQVYVDRRFGSLLIEYVPMPAA